MGKVRGLRGASVAGAVLVSLALAGPAAAGTITVHRGQSIQAAINAASPGDTIVVDAGHYHESLVITTDRITLRGAGASDGGTVLVPPADESSGCSLSEEGDAQPAQGAEQNGICIFGDIDFSTFTVLHYRQDVHVNGIQVQGFNGMGIFALGTDHAVITHTRMLDNGSYGIFSNTSMSSQIRYNYASGSGEAGIYVGDSPNSNASVLGNESVNNTEGFLLRDASDGNARSNSAHDNCVGMLLLDTGAPGPASNWTIAQNSLFHNDKACPPAEGPLLSGTGLGVFGGSNSTIVRNRITDNIPSVQNPRSGGITIMSSVPFGGSDPTNNVFRQNIIANNRAFGIRWDGSGTGNVFQRNYCLQTSPAGLCVGPA